ncbi:MAG TPA: glycoside hydrolase family 2, partial [Thermoanaerobaculia bacterium]|nr:glycoside hydrolase family 2 [Thermoanaerobaculia bacterium]
MKRAFVTRPGASGAAHAYPRPQLARAGWASLNGPWEFSLDPEGRWQIPDEVAWRSTIEVPFSPETPASGIGDTGFYRRVWYRRRFGSPKLRDGERLLLHFGAVDWAATVWINGAPAAYHEGGYTPFTIDATPFLRRGGEQT